ncbi:MAG: hypothetical protein R3C02_07760 [Planctomycetaceae bacterium]
MQLAIRFEGRLVRDGVVADYAELALRHVTRARMSQIMSLLHLALDIQEAILLLLALSPAKIPSPNANIQFNRRHPGLADAATRMERPRLRLTSTTPLANDPPQRTS